MNRKIIDRVAFLIDDLFPDIPFSDMQDTQGIKPPRFFITCYQNSVIPRIEPAGIFYTSNFDLVFDPGADEPEKRCNEIASILLPAIQKIPKEDGTNYRSDNIKSQYDREQEVLHIFFDVTTTLHDDKADDDPYIKRIYFTTDVEVVSS